MTQNRGQFGRRPFLQHILLGLSALPAVVHGTVAAAASTEIDTNQRDKRDSSRGTQRVIFLPCLHLRAEPEFQSQDGIRNALREAVALKPSLILTGGDLCHDLRTVSADDAAKRAEELKRLFEEIVPSSIPVHHVLGNHDAADWVHSFDRSMQKKAFDPVRRVLNVPSEPFQFEHGGWRFIGLHNVSLLPEGRYFGEWGEGQLRWLETTLGARRQPTVIFAHMPTVAASDFLGGSSERGAEEWSLSYRRATKDAEEFFRIARSADVKVVLNGHLHRDERVFVEGVEFICAGSVSGAQWTGEQGNTPPGFGVIDLRGDGTFDYGYHPHGWKKTDRSK